MDTRKYKQSSSQTDSVPKNYSDVILEQEDTILQYDKIKNDYKYLDATIFNLCEKIAIGDRLQQLYFENQQKELIKTSLPKWLKRFVHNLALIPIVCGSIILMKKRRTLSINKVALMLFGASIANEFFKYQYCLQMDDNLKKTLFRTYSCI